MKVAMYLNEHQFVSYCILPDEDQHFEFVITKPIPKGDALIPKHLLPTKTKIKNTEETEQNN